MNCDGCRQYKWYYDRCTKWNCEVDGRAAYDCFEPRQKTAAPTTGDHNNGPRANNGGHADGRAICNKA